MFRLAEMKTIGFICLSLFGGGKVILVSESYLFGPYRFGNLDDIKPNARFMDDIVVHASDMAEPTLEFDSNFKRAIQAEDLPTLLTIYDSEKYLQ
jgi:hypothetical protein